MALGIILVNGHLLEATDPTMNDLQRGLVLINHTDFDSARAVVENDEWPGHTGRGKFRVILLKLHVIQ